MSIRVIDSDEGLDQLADSWDRLVSEIAHPSIFSTFQYVRLAWQYFHSATDRLFILVVENEKGITGIAPFCIRQQKYWGIPARVVRFIAEWEGDRPGLITTADEASVWKEICRFLEKDFTGWDVINLAEQLQDSPTVQHGFEACNRFFFESGQDTVAYSVALTGGWDAYLSGRKSKVRQNWRSAKRKLDESFRSVVVTTVEGKDGTREAWARYKELEKKSWKADTRIGAAKDERHDAFYSALLCALAERGRVSSSFLTVDGSDIAASVNMQFGNRVYGRHITYDEALMKSSPGIILKAETIRQFFETPYEVFDFLGIRGGAGAHVIDWSTNEQRTVYRRIFNRYGRLFPVVLGKQLKRMVSGKQVLADPAIQITSN